MPASAQLHEEHLDGVVRSAATGEPLAGAHVSVVGSGAWTVTHGDGTFHLTGVAAGTHAVRVERLGYRGVTIEVTVGDAEAAGEDGQAGADERFVTALLEPSPIAMAGVVVTAAASERAAATAPHPVSVMSGDDLQRRMEGTVAATLESLPGLSATSMGPGVTQPVIRGMTGDRVLVLEDGVRVLDTSSSGSDHAGALSPASARRIEVVRGPRGLLYGGNALGGVINVISDEIPSAVPHHLTGAASAQLRTVTDAFAASGVASFALGGRTAATLEGSARTSGDMGTPLGVLPNTGADMVSASLGMARVADWGRAGASIRGYRNHYGIPGGFVGGHAEGVRIEMERFTSKFRTRVDDGGRAFGDLRFDASYSWYEHTEIEPPDILGTRFERQSLVADVLADHKPFGFVRGSLGARMSWEDFRYGGSLHTPDAVRTTVSTYFQEEARVGPVSLEWGLRYDWTGANPAHEDFESPIGHVRDRSFHSLSWSVGVLYNVAGGLTIGAAAARAARNPDIGELYSEGPHLAAYVYEVGNPSLGPERGRGLDAFARFESDRVRGEITGFHNDIQDFIYGAETGRLSRVLLPIYQFRGHDARFRGFEADLAVDLGAGFAVETAAASVKADLANDAEDPLPLIPPLNGRVALKRELPTWFVRGEVEAAARQDRVGEFETPTDGYAVLNLAAGVRLTLAGRLHVITASLDNAVNTEYRNHLSRVKEIMPEAGRGMSISARIVF